MVRTIIFIKCQDIGRIVDFAGIQHNASYVNLHIRKPANKRQKLKGAIGIVFLILYQIWSMLDEKGSYIFMTAPIYRTLI
jgi:hypothetical protein